MSICPSCGKELRDEFSFCPDCGSKIGTTNAFCTCCGSKYEKGNCFCPYCGAKNGICTPVAQEAQKPVEKKTSLKNAIVSLVFANIMPVFSLYSMFPIFCFAFFPGVILFYCLTIKYANLYENEAKRTIGFTTASRIVALVFLIIGILLFIVGFYFSFTIFNS